ncbi:hypothetical protein F4677DRAFT_14329 [Hypoxylon crocopeplum]|nr:hypothetical protein F4677DRAFT_14329 [Hypoxylon crocopeplum]
MGIWGRGLMQSTDDYRIVSELSEMFGCQLHDLDEEEDMADTVRKLDNGLLAEKFDKILSVDFKPRTSYHKRERVAIILGMLAMELGAKVEDRHMTALRVLRPCLPTMEQQLQLVTALTEYKNDGTSWKSGSKGLAATMSSKNSRNLDHDLGDEFWFSGLGHSIDEDPTSEMSSNVCLGCCEKGSNLLRCGRCKMARYCNTTCQRVDWVVHQRVCERRLTVRICPVPDLNDTKEPVINRDRYPPRRTHERISAEEEGDVQDN